MATKTQKETTQASAASNFLTLLRDKDVDMSQPTKVIEVIETFSLDTFRDVMSDSALVNLISLGIKRALSAGIAKSAKVGTPAYATEVETWLTALVAGYSSPAEMERAKRQALAPSTTAGGKAKTATFGRMEVIAQARSMADGETALATLDKIAAYSDEQFNLLLIKVSDNPQSLITRAISELARIANEKAEKELAAKMADIETI